MRPTSFGEMQILLSRDNKPQVEFLKFQKEGRPHKHREFESFFVTSGAGIVYVGEKAVEVKEGSLVVIPPDTAHWMKPSVGHVLEGLLWYHDTQIELQQSL